MFTVTKSIFTPLLLASIAYAAKTDLAGCTLTVVPLLTEIVTITRQDGVVTSTGNFASSTFNWNGVEQCQLIDCGGGRAPPKSTVPGCPLYTGTDTVPSLPFPTASLTLTSAAAAATTAAPGASPAASAPASPSAPLATNAAASSSPGPIPPTASPSNTPSATVTPSVSDTGSAAADLNPTTSSNPNGVASSARRRDRVLLGLTAVAAAALVL